jgi:outer membrane receptor for ferrienterochelin and colicins
MGRTCFKSRRLALAVAIGSGLVVSGAGAAEQLVLPGTTVVSAAGFEQQLAEAPASITVITRQQLQQQQVRNLGDALRAVEGVDVEESDARSNKTGNLTISLRGLPSRYTLVLIDGRRQNSPGTVSPNAFGDSAGVFIPPVGAIERIEIIRGPMSTLYGSDAMGGVVNIITRKAGNEWSGGASLEGTMQSDSDFSDSRALSAYVGGALVPDVLKLQLHGRSYDREEGSVEWPGQSTTPGDLRTMGQNPVRANNDSFGGKLILTPNAEHELALGVDSAQQDYNNDNGQLGRIASGSGYDDKLGFERDQVSLAHTWRLDAATLESSVARNRTETTGRLIPSRTPGKVVNSKRTLEATNTLLDSKLVMPLDAHVLSLGGQWWDAELKDGIAPSTYENRQWGLFGEDEWSLRQDLTLTGGLRYDKHDEFGGQFTPRAYLVWNTTDHWTLKGGVGKGYKTPWLEELAPGIIGYGNNGQTPLLGNPDLKPETSVNSEISALFDSLSGFDAQATLFHTKAKDLIARPTGATNVQFENIGEARIRGLELSSGVDLLTDLRLSGNYTFTDSEVKEGRNQGRPLNETPRHMVNAKLNWQITGDLSAFLGAEYRGTRFRDPSFHEPSLGGNAQGAKAGLGNFDSYSQFNLGGSYKVNEHLKVNATIYNLTNKDFNEYRPYVREDGGAIAYSNIYNNILEPRRLWVSLDASF